MSKRKGLIPSLVLVVMSSLAIVAACHDDARVGGTKVEAPMTPWGEPDLQSIWRENYQTPLQRPARFADKEFFTEEERAALDRQRAANLGRDERAERGTERDLSGSYNSVFTTLKHVGRRTSLIVDPPDGRIPPLTREAQRLADDEHEYRLALLQSTETCRTHSAPTCAGGKYDPRPSPRRDEPAPRYNTGRINRHDGPEDDPLGDRCLSGSLPPDFGNVVGLFIRIVQTPGGVTMFYDASQGQGWQRNIVMNGGARLPSNIHQWQGVSRGHWDGNTLVVEVTNFSPKTDFQGSREHLRLVERWTRVDTDTLEYVVTIDDPTVWTRPWTVTVEFNKQSDAANRIYYEPRCHEGNYGLPAILLGAREDERAYADGRGPHPATMDTQTVFQTEGGNDPVKDPIRDNRIVR